MADELEKTVVPGADDPALNQDAPNTGDPPGENGTSEGGEKPAFTQAQVEAIVKDRLERERKKAEKDTQKARDEAEAASLAEQKRFEDLASIHGKRLAEIEPQLETLAQKAERLEQTVQAYLVSQKEGLPAHLLALLEKMDPVDQLEYITANHAALFPEAPSDEKKPGGGVPPTPKGKGGGELTDEERRRKAVSARNYF